MERKKDIQYGKQYQVSEGSGVDSRRIGKVVPKVRRKHKRYTNYLLFERGWFDLIDIHNGERFCMCYSSLHVPFAPPKIRPVTNLEDDL